jgi:hypothetical protein
MATTSVSPVYVALGSSSPERISMSLSSAPLNVNTALPFHAPSNEELSRAIARIIPAEQWCAVMEGHPYTEFEINDEFLGFLKTYWHLAQLIPTHWTVVDLGCGYNPFHTPTSTHYTMTIGDFITQHGHTLNLKETFAICSYCPMWGEGSTAQLRAFFPNLYVYYPHQTSRPVTLPRLHRHPD